MPSLVSIPASIAAVVVAGSVTLLMAAGSMLGPPQPPPPVPTGPADAVVHFIDVPQATPSFSLPRLVKSYWTGPGRAVSTWSPTPLPEAAFDGSFSSEINFAYRITEPVLSDSGPLGSAPVLLALTQARPDKPAGASPGRSAPGGGGLFAISSAPGTDEIASVAEANPRAAAPIRIFFLAPSPTDEQDPAGPGTPSANPPPETDPPIDPIGCALDGCEVLPPYQAAPDNCFPLGCLGGLPLPPPINDVPTPGSSAMVLGGAVFAWFRRRRAGVS